MTQEDEELLLRYLSMALPYKVMIKYKGTFGEEPEPMILFNLNCVVANLHYEVEGCKPYLRPMSSMTEEEKEELLSILVGDENKGMFRVLKNGTIESTDGEEQSVKHFSFRWIDFSCESVFLFTDWLLKKHFDFMGLIPRGLAIEVTENNNPYK